MEAGNRLQRRLILAVAGAAANVVSAFTDGILAGRDCIRPTVVPIFLVWPVTERSSEGSVATGEKKGRSC
jgi:hypothetical protein